MVCEKRILQWKEERCCEKTDLLQMAVLYYGPAHSGHGTDIEHESGAGRIPDHFGVL